MQTPLDEASLWDAIISMQNIPLFTASGLPFSYTVKQGKDGSYNKELLIDRRENSKTLTWGSIRLAYRHSQEMLGQEISRPKALGDIRGISYIYPLLWKLGLIQVPEKQAKAMSGITET